MGFLDKVFKKEVKKEEKKEPQLNVKFELPNDEDVIEAAYLRSFQQPLPQASQKAGFAQDGLPGANLLQYGQNYDVLSPAVFSWYSKQSFIGYNAMAIISQHWLVNKACETPAKDAVRNGYELVVLDEEEVDQDVIKFMHAQDQKYQINNNMIELIKMGRVFGIRLLMFHIDSDDPEYYEKPFNLDGITPKSYKGIAQIDPFWVSPQLDTSAASDPAAVDFYEPTWWIINGRRLHRTHLIVFRTGHVPDVLKPTYFYGGVSIPQRINEKVYNAERTANEAPLLALTKRMDVWKMHKEEAQMNEASFIQAVSQQCYTRDNYGMKIIGAEEEMTRLDTSLADLDDVIKGQYEIVAAASNVPVTKLMGTSPKGMNSTGEYDESSYHEELRTIQEHDLTPFLKRHYEILIRSEVLPEYPDCPLFNFEIKWSESDAMTAKERAEVNKIEADTAIQLASLGAIDGQDERNRLIANKNSGYVDLDPEVKVPDLEIEPLASTKEPLGE